MLSTKIKKIIFAFIVSGGILILPALALAQFGLLFNSPATPLWTNEAVNPTTDLPFLAAIKAASIANQSCATAEQAFSVADTATQIGFGGLALITGGASLQTQLTAKAVKVDGFIACRQSVISSLEAIVTPDVITSQEKQTVSNAAAAAISSLKTKKETIHNQLTVAQQGFWKTLTYNILIKTTKSISTNLVTKLVNNYKIKNFSQYADAVATQVYDNQFIQQNYTGDNEGAMITRSMLSNPLTQSQVSPAVFARADAALGFDAGNLNTSDPNFYNQMAKVGTGQTNPFLQQVVLADQTQGIHSKALSSAQAEIAQSNGLKTPRNCVGTLQQQQDLDRSYKAANNQLADRKALLKSLTDAKSLGYNVNADDIKKAQADYDAAAKQLYAMPTSISSPTIDICKEIVSPPSLINKGIDQAFTALGQNMGTYNENNLPFFINFISDVANQIGNNLVLGGGQSGSNILDENSGNLAKGTALGLQFAANGDTSSIAKGIELTAPVKNGNFSDSYTLTWNINTDIIANASYITISGTGISGTNHFPLSGSTEIRTSSSSTYLLKVYDKSGTSLGTASVDLQVAASASSPFSGSGPQVFGTSTKSSVGIDPRSPEGISPR